MRKKSGNVKRINRRTPGGRRTVIYKRKKHSPARCAICGAILAGVPTGSPGEIRGLPKTKRRPNRRYGGYLCPKCMRLKVSEEIRGMLY